MFYVCSQVNEFSDCVSWVQQSSFASLSYSDGAALAGAIIICWSIAFGLRVIIRFVLNR